MRFLLSAILFVSLILSIAPCGYPQSASAKALCEYAKSLYSRGEIEDAKSQFSKVLLIDPDNAMAKRYLQKMGLKKGLYRPLGVSSYQNQDEVYKKAIRSLQETLRAKNKELIRASETVQEQERYMGILLAEVELARRDKDIAALAAQSELNEVKEAVENLNRQLRDKENSFFRLEADAGILRQERDKCTKMAQESTEALKAKDKEIEALREKEKSWLEEKAGLEAEAGVRLDQLNKTMAGLQKNLQSELNDYKAKLEMAQRGIILTMMTDVLFDSGKVEVNLEGKEMLEKISNVFEDVAPQNNIIIEGYTDDQPVVYSSWISNWELSAARALSVLKYFIYDRGLSPGRFSIAGYGEFRPVADNFTESGRRQNRRVEIVILPYQVRKVEFRETAAKMMDLSADVD